MKDFTPITKAMARLVGQIEQMSPNQHQKLSEQLATLGSRSLRTLNAVVSPAIELAEENEERMATLEKEREAKELQLKETVLDTIKNSELSELLKQHGESASAEDLLMQLFNTKPSNTSKRKPQKKTAKRQGTASTTAAQDTTTSSSELAADHFTNTSSLSSNSTPEGSQSAYNENEYT